MTVLDSKEGRSGSQGPGELDGLRKLLELQTSGTIKDDDVEILCHAITGTPADAICSLAREIDAPLILCGTTGKGAVARTLLGSVSHELVERSGAIVMSIP